MPTEPTDIEPFDAQATTAASVPPLRTGMLVYPMMTLLDLAGPQSALGMHGKTYLVWKDRGPVLTDSGIAILPTHTFEDCPDDLDILFAPGGFGTAKWMEDEDVIGFLAQKGASAKYVTSVCSGALLLAAAGLLDGYKAATHWKAHDALAAMGVEAVRERVVHDRNRMTGGGVTAGIDFGLMLLAELRGEMVAKTTQLAMEYDPKPPFRSGTPETAEPEVLEAFEAMTAGMGEETAAVVARINEKRAA